MIGNRIKWQKGASEIGGSRIIFAQERRLATEIASQPANLVKWNDMSPSSFFYMAKMTCATKASLCVTSMYNGLLQTRLRVQFILLGCRRRSLETWLRHFPYLRRNQDSQWPWQPQFLRSSHFERRVRDGLARWFYQEELLFLCYVYEPVNVVGGPREMISMNLATFIRNAWTATWSAARHLQDVRSKGLLRT